jgi:hypothetical protein
MSINWGMGFDAEIAYRHERLRADYRHPWRRRRAAANAAADMTSRASADLRSAALAHSILAAATESVPSIPAQRVGVGAADRRFR